MPAYWVTVNGENFLVNIDGVVAKHGFYAHRCVSADDPQAAWDLVAQMLRDDENLRALVKNSEDDRPEMNLEAIQEVSAVDPNCPSGYIWYPMVPAKRWWQFWRR